jgi:hypothetical protein
MSLKRIATGYALQCYRLSARVAIISLAISLELIAPVAASCGLGKQPSYSDISAVRYKHTACRGGCAEFEVLFSTFGLYYVGRAHVQMRGTYQVGVPARYDPSWKPEALRLATAALEKAQFYRLSVRPSIITDVPHLIISVERCRVTTILDFANYGQRPDIEKVADELDEVVTRIPWQKVSNTLNSPLPSTAWAP